MAPPSIVLVLYVTPDSVPCQRAVRTMREILARYEPDGIDFSICDLTIDPAGGERDRIVFTPTLLKRAPLPNVWVLGDLARPEVVTDLLHLCGATPRS